MYKVYATITHPDRDDAHLGIIFVDAEDIHHAACKAMERLGGRWVRAVDVKAAHITLPGSGKTVYRFTFAVKNGHTIVLKPYSVDHHFMSVNQDELNALRDLMAEG